MTGVFKSKLFWVTAIIVAAIVFLVGINTGKLYKGETNILVLPKSDQVARNVAQIMGDVKEIPLSLKFYDIMLQENSDIEDQFAELPDYKRKDGWNSQIRVEEKKGSGVLSVNASSASQLQASIVSLQTAKDIAVVMSHYYDIKTELEIRLIDGPITRPVNNFQGLGLTILSVVLGLIVGGIVYFLIGESSPGRRETALPKLRANVGFPSFTLSKTSEKTEFRPEATTETKTELEKTIFAQPAVKKETPVDATRKAAAPENLPVGSEFVISSLRRAEKTSHQKEEEARIEPKTHEATEEEIRARLNKLLGGRM